MIQDGDGEVSVQKDTKVYFGEKTEQAGALNWSIANAKAGEKYYLYIPYDAKETDKTMFQSFMLRESAPKLDEATANMSMLSVYDMEVASGGAIVPDKLTEQYAMGAAHMIIAPSDMKSKDVANMIDEIKDIQQEEADMDSISTSGDDW